jgi:hypothetical protein
VPFSEVFDFIFIGERQERGRHGKAERLDLSQTHTWSAAEPEDAVSSFFALMLLGMACSFSGGLWPA